MFGDICRGYIKMDGGWYIWRDVLFEKKHGPHVARENHANIKYLCGRGVVGNCQAKYISEIQAARGVSHHLTWQVCNKQVCLSDVPARLMSANQIFGWMAVTLDWKVRWKHCHQTKIISAYIGLRMIMVK